jgi:hypothetical protein
VIACTSGSLVLSNIKGLETMLILVRHVVMKKFRFSTSRQGRRQAAGRPGGDKSILECGQRHPDGC